MLAIYARLSVNENGERDESLETQCDLLKTYAAENGLGAYKLYIDSDISGTCFDRPGLIGLVSDINNNTVGTVLVKDLSRLGRNNGETLTFLDFLQEKNVRLIALGDNYDSFRDDDEIIGIRTWVNEHYARDISKKVRYNLKKKMQNGEFLGRPPFGYLKSPGEKNRLVVNEQYREVIPKIFELYIAGWGYRALAGYIQGLGLPTPSRDKGYLHTPKTQCWNEQHIRRIITNRVYCGDSVQGVSEKVSFKSRKTRRLGSERWIIVPGTHEPLISREVFELAQQVRLKRWRAGEGRKKSTPHLFTGFLVCGCCGSHHVYRKKKHRPARYVCGNYHRYGRAACTGHAVAEELLLQYIVQDVKHLAKGISLPGRLLQQYRENMVPAEELEKNIRQLESRLAGYRRQQRSAYLDKLRGIISEELFCEANVLLEKEQEQLAARLEKLKENRAELAHTSDLTEKIKHITVDLLQPGDIDRAFLERYVKKIIMLEEGESPAPGVAEKYGLTLSSACRPAGPVIFYNLAAAGEHKS